MAITTSNSLYCSAPWNGITVREDGHVRTCCNGKVSLRNLNETSIYQIQKSSKLKEIQDTMLSGRPDPENCAGCMQAERDTGLAALRQHYLKFYPSHGAELKLRNLDIRWNNSCNLGCMYCSPQFSSTWVDRLAIPITSPVKGYHDELLEFILDNADQVEELMLVGGEPMLMKQNYRLLSKLPDTTTISIMTNLSYDLERLPCIEDLLRRPANNTRWNISCENIGKQYEYVRNGGEWELIEKNLKFINTHWPEVVSISMVYSMFSAFDIADTIKKFHQLGCKKFMFQSYSDSYADPAMNVFKMPSAIQQLALEQLELAQELHDSQINPEDKGLYPLDNLSMLMDMLRKNTDAPSQITKQQFLNNLENYNRWNKHTFQELWPNVMDLINTHLK